MSRVVRLNNGVEMPIIGFGVYQVDDLKECEESVYNALMTGYRLIDTAALYKNEEAVGKAIKRSGIPREEIFVTTKVWTQDMGYEKTKKAFETSLKKLDLKYIDLYLLHQSFGDIYGSWRAMEELVKEGKIRAIGVSNFLPDRLVDFVCHVNIIPAVNQIETHPFCQQIEANKIMKDLSIQIESWGPFAEGKNKIFENPTLVSIAEKHHKNPAQVILRYLTQRDIIVIPKSVHKERIEQNFKIFDFALSDDEMEEILKLDTGKCLIMDHRDPGTVKAVNSLRIHE